MQIDANTLEPKALYHWMTQTVVPRPIAWVLTENRAEGKPDRNEDNSEDVIDAGHYNLAPFSYFNAMGSAPPTLIVSIGKKPDGAEKDTRYNLQPGQPCVVHIPAVADAEAVAASAATVAYGTSEIESNNLRLIAWPEAGMPRLETSLVAFACRVAEVHELGAVPQALILLTIEQIFIDDSVIIEDGKGRPKVDAMRLAPLARLGADEYASLGEVIRIARPA